MARNLGSQQRANPQSGPVAQRLAMLQSDEHITASQRRRMKMLILLALAATIIASGGILWWIGLPWYVSSVLIIIGLIAMGYLPGLSNLTGFSQYTSSSHPQRTEFQRAKTFWDWLQLLIIPLVLAGAALWFNAQQNEVSRQIAADQQRETTLKTYLDNLSDLMLKDHLRESIRPVLCLTGQCQEPEVRVVARALTLSALRNLDSKRKGTLLQFLQEANLIGRADPIILLSRADLSYADLSYLGLSDTSLRGAVLSYANLSGAVLSGSDLKFTDSGFTDLSGADLRGTWLNNAELEGVVLRGAYMDHTNLSNSILEGANLRCTDLRGADLRGADLQGADLQGAQITNEQLAQLKSYEGAVMPDGVNEHAGTNHPVSC